MFFQKDSGLRPPDPPRSMQFAMILFAAMCILLGVFPDPLYAMPPYAVDYVLCTEAHVVAQPQLLLFSGLALFVMLNYLRRTLTITLDTDWLYRRLAPALAGAATRGIAAAQQRAGAATGRALSRLVAMLQRQHGAEGARGRISPTGRMALRVMVLLLAYLLLYCL